MTGIRLLVALLLLAGNAFFVGAQFALITARRDQIEPLARAGGRRARLTLGQMRGLSTMLAGSQLGIGACSLGLGATAEPTITELLQPGFDALGIPGAVQHPLSFLIALIIVAYCHMVLGEMVPKNLALAGPVAAALTFGPPMAGWVWLTRPLLRVITAIANGILRLFGVRVRQELTSAYSPEDLAHMVSESAEYGLIDAADRQRLTRALALERRTARDVAVPLDRVVTATTRTTVEQVEHLVGESGFSRFPVESSSGRTGTLGAGRGIVGYIHVKDLLDLDERSRHRPIPRRYRRPVVTVPADMPLSRVLPLLQRGGSGIARVMDERTTVGVLTLEDIVEDFLGEAGELSAG